jgi:hypothetical protein
MVEKQSERKLKVLRTDNGMEFCSADFKSLCKKEGIVRHHTIPHTPQQNGVAECMNKTIISKACCMLSNSGLSIKFWAEVVSTACHLINCSLSTAVGKKTPIEVWSASPYDYSQLRVFCCTAYEHVDNCKLEPRAIKCIFLGSGSGVKAYKLWNPEAHKIFYSRNIVFNESTMFTSDLSTSATNQNSESISVQVEHIDDNVFAPPFGRNSSPLKHSSPAVQPPRESLIEGRTRRQIVWLVRLIEECNVAFALSVAEEVDSAHEPLNYSGAILSADIEKLIGAMHEEMESLEKNGSWDVVHLPSKKTTVKCKWIFKRKECMAPNEPARYKAMLVAKGFSQILEIDYIDVYSPVVKHSFIRTFLSLVAIHDYELEQLDVKIAFLHGDLEEDIYMDQPDGFIVPGKEDCV